MGISAIEFETVRRLVYERSAIVLEPGKEYLVEARLAPLARAAGCSINHVVSRLRLPPEDALRQQVVEAMTTNETAFFRDIKPFDTLRNHVLPDVIERNAATRRLDIWCAASSSGQEPYSIAMLLREHFPELLSWQVRILCTDISGEMVERTQAGRFSQLEIGRGLPSAMLVKYFDRDGLDWVVRPELRRWLDVRQMNLAAAWPAIARQDIVFCRNVLIYFDVDTKRLILRRIRELIGPSGCLFLGSAETTRGIDDLFESTHIGGGGFFRPIGAGTLLERRAS